MQVDMRQQTEVETRAPGQQFAGQVERHAVDIHPPQLAQADILQAHQGQRRQEMLAELAISHPGRALPLGFEAEGIDQDG